MNDGKIIQPQGSQTTPPTETPVEPPTESLNTAQDFSSEPSEPLATDLVPHDPAAPVTWTASEFIAHQKSFGWYTILAVVIFALSGLAYLVTRDVITAGVIIICGILFGIYAGHQPRELDYVVDAQGLSIAGKHYSFEQFRSFAVMEEGAFVSINLLPLRRFAPGLTIYLSPQDEQAVADILAERLPREDRSHDPVDRLMRRIRF